MYKINKKLGLYIRVSSEKQLEEGFSFQAQKEKLIAEANREKQDYVVYEDGGISGTKTEDRVGLKQLMKDVELGLISKVYVTKISRLARNSRDLHNIIYEFNKHDVTFKAINDGIDTSNMMGKYFITMMGMFAEMERDVIIEQTRAGAEKRAKEGKMYGSGAVLGYDRVIDETSKKNTMKIIINEKEKEIIKTIYEMYLGGYGYKAITNKLNKEGFRTKKHKLFAINTVKTVLENPLYAGYIRYGKYKDWNMKRRKGLATEHILVEGNHESIITKEEWDQVQEKMKQNQRRKPPVGKYMLAGVLTCPECGSKMVGSKTKYKTKNGPVERLYYTCSQFHNKGLTACHANGIRVDLIDPIAIKKIAKKINSDEVVNQLYNYVCEVTADTNSYLGKKRLIEIEIREQDKRKVDLRGLYADGMITIGELTEDLKKIADKTKEYEVLLEELENESTFESNDSLVIRKSDVKDFICNISETLKTTDDQERLKVKEIVGMFVENISLKDKTKVTLDIDINFSEMSESFIGTGS